MPSENPLRDKAYLDHIDTCRKLGVTPLTREEFIKEDRRLIVDWNRRRHGLDLETTQPPWNKPFKANFWTRLMVAWRILWNIEPPKTGCYRSGEYR